MNLLTEFREGLGIALAAIRANKMRSALTTLGIVIGVVTVTLMGTAIEGLNRAFMKSVSFIGADVLYVQKTGWFFTSHEDWMRAQKRKPITLAQMRALERELTLARAVSPVAVSQEPVKFKNNRSERVAVIGTTDQYVVTSGIGIAEGRFLSPGEAQGARPVCVIGADVATNLFVREPAIGQRLTVGQSHFEVVGILEKQGSFMGAVSLDNQVIVPLGLFMTTFRNRPDIDIHIKVADLALLEDAREETLAAMRRVRRLAPGEAEDFSINQQDQFIAMFNKIAGTIGGVGLFITGLSLFVGGIGIMNIMFVSVAERTREIGIRKAIGAKRRTILIQFLTEAAAICLLGGLLALAIAWPLTWLMSRFLPATLSPVIVGIALLVSILTGLVAGFLPAWRAARLNPVDALRNET